MSLNKHTKKLINKILRNHNNSIFLEGAFEIAKKYYRDEKTAQGESYFDHVVGTASVLDDLQLDALTIVAGIFHDVLETADNKEQCMEEIVNNFGKETLGLVQKFSEIKRVYFSFQDKTNALLSTENIENTRRMFLAIAGDIRVVLIELAARIDRLKKIKDSDQEIRKKYAFETIQLFVPISHRLGLGSIKRDLEDLAFENLFEKRFISFSRRLKKPYEERMKLLKKFIPHLRKIFKKEHTKFLEVNYRAKSYWSSYLKVVKRGASISKIYDLIAIRIITDTVEDCYLVLGVLHKYFKPIPESIKDYIAKPKKNGYRSLHTVIALPSGDLVEVQIRTQEMHQEAEFGICAHWAYKENIDLEKSKEHGVFAEKIQKMAQGIEIDFFKDEIFVFTPTGDVISLPNGSCPVDFAYAIHSDIGNTCESAKIGGKIVPLNQKLKNGDIVEIITKKRKKPSADWLKFVKTNFAKSHIRKKLDRPIIPFQLKVPNVSGIVKQKFSEIAEIARTRKLPKKKKLDEKPKHIYLAGQKGILMHAAKCCNPTESDITKAYVAPGRPAVLHKISCKNFKKISEKYPERIFNASWM